VFSSPTKDVYEKSELNLAGPLLLVFGLTKKVPYTSLPFSGYHLQEFTVFPTLPFCYIFSTFMIFMMLGLLLYTAIISSSQIVPENQC